jgi:hypothetical protein
MKQVTLSELKARLSEFLRASTPLKFEVLQYLLEERQSDR